MVPNRNRGSRRKREVRLDFKCALFRFKFDYVEDVPPKLRPDSPDVNSPQPGGKE